MLHFVRVSHYKMGSALVPSQGCGHGLQGPLHAASERLSWTWSQKHRKNLCFLEAKGPQELTQFNSLSAGFATKETEAWGEGTCPGSHGGRCQFMLPEDTGHRFCWKSKLPKRKIAYAIWFGQQLRSSPLEGCGRVSPPWTGGSEPLC